MGTDRVIDLVRPWLKANHRIDLASRELSLFAFAELAGNLARTVGARLMLPPDDAALGLLGSVVDRAARNRLQGRWLAGRCAAWLEKTAEVRSANGTVPQGAIVLRNGDGRPGQALLGSFSFSTDGLGLAPGNPLNLIQTSETPEECDRLGAWFDAQWSALTESHTAKADLVEALRRLAAHRDPSEIYALILHHLFRTEGGDRPCRFHLLRDARGRTPRPHRRAAIDRAGRCKCKPCAWPVSGTYGGRPGWPRGDQPRATQGRRIAAGVSSRSPLLRDHAWHRVGRQRHARKFDPQAQVSPLAHRAAKVADHVDTASNSR